MDFPGGWTDNVTDIEDEFDEPNALAGCTVVWAEYETGSYCGDAHVVWKDASGALFETDGSHCSCYGLEGQWSPEATSKEAILMRPDISPALRAVIEAL